MHTQKPTLYLLSEKEYANTTWCIKTCEGIYKEAAKRSVHIVNCNDSLLSKLTPGSIVVLLCSSYPFALQYIRRCTALGLRPIIAGFEFFQTDLLVSYITTDRRRSMSDIVRALISCGAKHIALLGVHSSIQTDMHKYHGYADMVLAYQAGNPKTDVYYSNDGLLPCMEAFWKNYEAYDAVACANDYYAIQLCYEARKRGIEIPKDLMVTGYGNTRISQFTAPSLTTVSLNFTSMGMQVLNLYRILSKNPDMLSCNAALKSEIVFRGSTRQIQMPMPILPVISDETESDFESSFEEYLFPIYALEKILTTVDATDFKLLQGLLDQESYGVLAEKLFLSDTAFKHRLYKLFHATGCQNRKELTALLSKYMPHFQAELLI